MDLTLAEIKEKENRGERRGFQDKLVPKATHGWLS
jgi:hypothetical protein